jgi:sulfite reductase beta subunit-like hemoprotein
MDGREVKGVEIRTGGGTSIMPRVGSTLFDFVEVENGDYLKVSEAVLRVFDRQDWLRANRQRARLKFMVDKVGIDAFREEVEQELALDWVNERDFTPDELLFLHDEEANAPQPPVSPVAPGSPNGDNREFDEWVETNVRPQRQEGFSTAEVRVLRGDLTPEQYRGVAQLMRDFTGGYARTSIQQNLVLRWIRDESLYDVWTRLKELNLGDPGADEVTNVVSCPGTDSCKLGITSSMGLNRAVEGRVSSMNITDPLTRRIHIKMSGCPNGCSQHHLGSIGFYGASMKVGGKQIPAYVAHIGGRYEEGHVAYGTRLKVRLPAKRVPDAVERWIRMYEADRQDGEPFDAFFDRVGTEPFERAVKDLSMPVEFNLENIEHFIDWSRSDPYKVVRGEGECAV